MRRRTPLHVILLATGLLGCASDSPLSSGPGKYPKPPSSTDSLRLHILPSNDTIVLRVFTFSFLSAAVYNQHEELWSEPQPEIVWSISGGAGDIVTTDSLNPSTRMVTGVGVGVVHVVARAPLLDLADTVAVRVWSPVASLEFELESDTVYLSGHIGWRLAALDSTGAGVNRELISVTASLDSVASVTLRAGVAERLGTGTITARAPPFAVERPITVIPLFVDAIRLGDAHSCVRREDARLMCGGQNAYLQLGRATPLQCWGFFGQYCVNGFAGRVEVPDLGDVVAFDATAKYSCAIRVGGELLCWGASSIGQLGTTVDNWSCGNPFAGYMLETCLPGVRPVGSPQLFHTVSTGWSVACAVALDDRAWCWGSTATGARLGNGSVDGSATPVVVNGEHAFRTIAAGHNTTCAVDRSDVAWCWGFGGAGELGAGPGIATATEPVRVAGGISFASVENGRWGTCGLSTAGQAYCWGGNEGYRGGTPFPDGCLDEAIPNTCLSTPLAVAGDLRFTELAVGGDACGVTAAGEVWCWQADAPQRVTGIPPLSGIVVSFSYGCGISSERAFHCWNNSTRAASARGVSR